MKILCIYNPQAGGGNSTNHLDEVKQLFDKYDIDAEIVFTEHSKHSTEIVKEKDLTKYAALMVAGGDGSFFNALNGYMQKPDNQRIPLAILPVGTGNSLSRDVLGEEGNIEMFVKLLKNGKTKRYDIAKVKNEKETFYYANMMGFGFINDVIETASHLKWLKSLSYTLGVIYNTIKLNTFDLTITIDGEEQVFDNVFVVISNSKYTGGNYLIAPKAELNDGKLDLIILNRLSRINLLKTFPKIFDGSHINSEFVDYVQAEKISLRAKVPKNLSPDGEIYGEFPADISCLKGAIEIFSA
jgi:YegS/Rv2252/BmrU family lipid kinase